MKKVLASASTAIVYLSTALPSFAQNLNPCPSTQGKFQNLCVQGSRIPDVIGKAITIVFIIAVLLALAFLIWGGIRWILSGGDKGKVEAARSTIIAAIVGLVIIFLSYFILQLVLGFFGLGFGDLTLPTLVG